VVKSAIVANLQATMSSNMLQCPHCSVENEIMETVYIEDEGTIHEYTMCGVCDNLVASSVPAVCSDASCGAMEPERNSLPDCVSNSCNRCDEDASGDHNETILGIPCPDFEFDMPSQTQSVKHSCSSAFQFDENTDIVDIAAYPATSNNGDMSNDSLKQLREVYCQNMTCDCTGSASEILPVDGVKGVVYCSGCHQVYGLDDTMNYYDLLGRGDYAIEPCDKCGNSDPHLFVIESDCLDALSLRCLKCGDVDQDGENASVNDIEMTDESDVWEMYLKEWVHYECRCGKSNPDLQKITPNLENGIIFVKCLVCQREDQIMLDAKPKICSCGDDSCVDIKFDEFGYASKLMCLQCRAEMDCGPDAVADVPATGDGTPTGRTRITAISYIQIGDHIAWHQLLGYWHHAIVTDVNGMQIRVINYNGPCFPQKGMLFCFLLLAAILRVCNVSSAPQKLCKLC